MGDGVAYFYIAFVAENEGVIAAFLPRRAENRDHAVRAARVLAASYAGAMAWSVDSSAGKAGIHVLFSQGAVGDID